MTGGQHRRGGGAQGGGHGQFAQQARIAIVHIGQHAEGGHRQQALRGIGGMAVDVLERVKPAIRDRHQLDHPQR